MAAKNKILTSLKKFTQQKNHIQDKLENEEEMPIFSRIVCDTIKKCNFCTKTSYYQDMENKLYCWFHRSQFE